MNNFGRKGWGLVIFVLFLFLISAAAVDLLNVSVDAFASMKGWDGNSLLTFSGIGTWLGIGFCLILGFWVGKKGVKIPTFIFLIIFGILYIINGLVDSVPAYAVVLVLLNAVAGSINLISTNTFMSNWFPRKKGIALGWSTMGLCISSAVAPPIFAALLGSTNSLFPPYLFFGIVAIALGFITMFVMKAYPEEAGAYPDNDPESKEKLEKDRLELENYKSPWTVKKLLTTRQVWFVAVGFGLLFIGIMGTITQFVPRFMASGFDQPTAIMWLSIASIIGIPASYAWGFLDQKTSTKFASVIYAVYMIILHFMNAVFFDSETASIILIVLFGILIGGIGNLFPSMVIQVFGRYDFTAANRIVVPILTAVRACTFIIMPIVLTASHGDYRVWHIVLGIVACVALVFVCLMKNKTIGKTEERETDGQAETGGK